MSVYFQHLAFLWPFDPSLFQQSAFWMARKRKKYLQTWHPRYKPPGIRQRNYTANMKKSSRPLSLNNGTDWQIIFSNLWEFSSEKDTVFICCKPGIIATQTCRMFKFWRSAFLYLMAKFQLRMSKTPVLH